tara:strand:- start:434 stop:634 length:201 start_codon:yes stop_codon:yes gene_type:complete
MSELKGLEDRLIKKGSPKSVNNGGVPTTANLAPGIIPINNTFSKGKYEDFAVLAGVTTDALTDTTG